jgi:hypothetical protein
MSEYRHTPDSLADRLDELLPPGHQEPAIPDSDPLIQAASWLSSSPQPQISPEAMSRIQAQVIQMGQMRRSLFRNRFPQAARWSLAASVVLLLMFVGAIPSSLASVPGDFLYPVKRAIEQGELAFANSPETSAATHLTHAERRSQEAAALLARGQFDPALIDGAINELATAAQIVRGDSQFDAVMKDNFERQTALIIAQVNTVLALASDAAQISELTVVPLMTEIYVTQNGGGLLLPTATPTTRPSPTDAPTYTPIPPTETLLPTATQTASPLPTETATHTATSLPVNLIIEGPVEAVNGNIIIIYGFEIELSLEDPLLVVIQIGDVVRIDGNFDGGIVVAIKNEIVNADVTVNEAGEVWRDTGDCTNPPPAWATASGWRARCQEQSQPGNNGNNGNNRNNRNNNDQDDDD